MPIRVLVVDDSAVMRTMLVKLLSSDPGIEVVGTAPDPFVARDKLVALRPDVMTLDVEMPRMDGLTFLEKVMGHLPTRTVVLSSLATEGSATYFRAFEVGAVDVVEKPALDLTRSLESLGAELIQRVKDAAVARLVPRLPKGTAAAAPKAAPSALARTTHQILAIAASTGGTEALKVLLAGMPADIPGTVIVQHMPPVFTKTFAGMLDAMFPFSVREAVDGDRVLPGLVLLAPGNFHMRMERVGAQYRVRLDQAPLLHGVRPAADHLLRSVAACVGSNAVGAVLTGMGRDGAEGLLAMRQAGAFTMAQDEASSVIYGMPKVTAEIGAAMKILPLDRIADAALAHIKRAG